jgi:[1-hydroxy-2-(trimethylamino)ethyl]phosphonate dioxygenase
VDGDRIGIEACHPSDIVATQHDWPMKASRYQSPSTTPLASLDELFVLLASGADQRCEGEPVTQLEHAMQCAALARQAGASEALVTAALLHDIGHLQPGAGEVDDRHELVGARWLCELFGPEVIEPIRLHVAAKRYLVGTAADYRDRLTTDSVRSLELQGGPMSAAECDAFRAQPFWADAVRLRVWDELAKDPTAPPQRLARFVDSLEAARRRR